MPERYYFRIRVLKHLRLPGVLGRFWYVLTLIFAPGLTKWTLAGGEDYRGLVITTTAHISSKL